MEDHSFERQILSKRDKMYRFALSILKNRQDAEDAAAQAVMKLWQSRKRLPSYESIDKVLFVTVKRCCIDLIRKRKDHLDLSENLVDDSNEGSGFLSARAIKVQQIIAELPEKQRTVIHLRMVEQYPMSKIAEIMDEKVNTIEAIVSRARKKIREAYAKPANQ